MVEHQHLVVMGVAGVGKTTVATLLAERLGWAVAEADDFHPAANIVKMASGVPLDDDDRWPWLRAIRDWTTEQETAGTGLGRHLLGAQAQIPRRAASSGRPGQVRAPRRIGRADRRADPERSKHFMPPALLPSQFAILEPLDDDEDGVVVPVADTPEAVVDDALRRLGLRPNLTPDRRPRPGP